MSRPTYDVDVVPDLPYAERGGLTLFADLYIPRQAPGPLPAIVWLHAGGWKYGSRKLAPDLTRFFACAGFVMVAIDYSLTAREIFPAQIEDVKTALGWLREISHDYGLDPDRVGLFGSSAGGNLAAMTALTPEARFRRAGPSRGGRLCTIRAVVDGYGPTDFLQMDAHRPPAGTVSDDPENIPLPRGMSGAAQPDSFESLLLGAPIGSCPDRVRDANPITYASAAAPPFLILHGVSDTTIPAHQSELLFEALAAGGADVTLGLIEGLGHGFLHRTHLDDGPPRRWRIRSHAPGRGLTACERVQPVFSTIEAFFRSRLLDAEGSGDATA